MPRKALVQLAIEHGFVTIEDDPYGELHFDQPAPAMIYAVAQAMAGAAQPVIYLSSLCKTVAPSLRIGWMVAPADVLRRSVITKQTMDLTTWPLARLINANHLALGRYPAVVMRARTRGSAARMPAMIEEIDRQLPGRLTDIRPGVGMFVRARSLDPFDAPQLFDASVDAGVLHVPGRPPIAAHPCPTPCIFPAPLRTFRPSTRA